MWTLRLLKLTSGHFGQNQVSRFLQGRQVFFAQWIIGIVLALLAAIFMFDGDILGENTAGISTIIGIVGISLIATSSIHLLPFGRK